MGIFLMKCQRQHLPSIMLVLLMVVPISSAISSDGEVLLSFKTAISGSDGVLLHWRQEDPDPCDWKGVTCDNHTKRVIYLSLAYHKLIGSISPEISKLSYLKRLALHGNSLYGTMPPELGNCTQLQFLYLQGNYLSGFIPSEFGNLLELETLDISSNTLSGSIPPSLDKLTKLKSFNVSMNFLTGVIPSDGALIKFAETSFVGNRGLCGKQIGVICKDEVPPPSIDSQPPTSGNKGGKKNSTRIVISAVATVCALLFVALMCFWGCFLYKKFGKGDVRGLAVDVSGGASIVMFHGDLPYSSKDILRKLETLNDENIIGSGGFGTVYKLAMDDGNVFALKRIMKTNEGLDRFFDRELEILGSIKHRYLVNLRGYCNSPSSKLLIYDYLPGGSLDEVLHERSEQLDWDARLNIIMGAAKGLAYLHHDCSPRIIHRDIKSSNILLDGNLEARVSDFGLAKLLEDEESHITTIVAGTFGYLAPEYMQSGRATEKTDVYSFGVLVLEVLSGKRPTDSSFIEKGLNIVGWMTKKVSFCAPPSSTREFRSSTYNAKEAAPSSSGLFSNVRDFLATGLLEGVPVIYKFKKHQIELHGFIKGDGYQCGCSSCNYDQVLSAYEFERHAKVTSSHPNNHIFLDNDKTLHEVVKYLTKIPLESLYGEIKRVTGCSIDSKRYEAWRKSVAISHDKSQEAPQISFQTASHNTERIEINNGTNKETQHQSQLLSSMSFQEGQQTLKASIGAAEATTDDLPTISNASRTESKRPHHWLYGGHDLGDPAPNKKRGVELLDICGCAGTISTQFSVPGDAAEPPFFPELKEPEISDELKTNSKITGSIMQTPETKERNKGRSRSEGFLPCTPNKREPKVPKYTPNSLLTDVKGLLSTRLLEGLPVKYKKDKVEVHGFVKNPGYRCGCSSCNYSKVVSAYEFERHAKVTTSNQNNHIFLESGISLYNLVKELKNIHLHSLGEVIEEKIGCAANMEGYGDWKESFKINHDLPKTSTNAEKIQQSQPEPHGEPYSNRSSARLPTESITGPAPSVATDFSSAGPATECIISSGLSVTMEDSLPCPAAEGSSNPDSSVRKMFSSSGPDTEGTVDPASSINVEFTTTTPDAEGNSNPALNISIHGLHKCSMMESKSGLESRTAKRLGLPKSPANTLQQKATAQGGPKKRDLDLHRMIFKEHGLPEGSKLAYRVKGKDVLIGYKSGNGIMCSCCDTNVSPSQFEAHAGLAVRRQPYHHIYTSDGLSLHEVSISLINDQNSTAKCCECTICGDGGVLISCHTCSMAFHAVCLKLQCEPDGEWDCPYCTDNVKSKLAPSKGCSSAVRPVDLRLRRILKHRADDLEYCVLCKNGSFTNPEFDANSCVFCGQCDRLYHFSCLEDPGSCEVKEVWDCKWFCCRDCGTVHAALQDLVNNGPNIIPESLMSILKRNPEERNLPNDAEADVQWRLIRGTDYEEINSEDKVLLWKAKLFLEDSFQPIECCGRNLIGAMVHGLEVPGLDCRGMYCVVITEKADPASGDFSKYNLRPLDLASAGVLRIFGTKVAELPLAVTYKGYRGKGYFRTLLLLIERLLSRLKVEFLVVSVDEDVRSIWINKLGFAEVTKERLQAYVEHPIVMFENTIVLGKAIPPSLAEES